MYNVGRFVIKEKVKDEASQQIMTHVDVVTAVEVREKLCLVGVLGGFIVLWDLDFVEPKLEFQLPEISLGISTIGFTTKHIYVTDTKQPNNSVYCYDLRTTKLLSHSKYTSLEPMLKSLTIAKYHITACADGVWFSHHSTSSS